MEFLLGLQTIYHEYLALTEQMQKEKNPLAGFFGFGNRPGNDPCHAEFAARVQSYVAAASGLSPREAQEAVWYLLCTPEENRKNELAYWMLLALQGQAVPLLAMTEGMGAGEMLDWYEKQYPRRVRLPVQKSVLKALQAAAK